MLVVAGNSIAFVISRSIQLASLSCSGHIVAAQETVEEKNYSCTFMRLLLLLFMFHK